MVRSILVRAICGLSHVAFREVTEMAHVFGPMLSIVVVANIKHRQVLQHLLKVTYWFVVVAYIQIATFIKKLLEVFKLARTNSFRFFTFL